MGSLYTKYKIFYFKDKLDSLPADVDRILSPIHIRIKPTNICCHNCWYCAYRANQLQLGKDMNLRDTIPEQKMLEIIDDLAEMKIQAVTFTGGGDPFCYPYLLSAAKKLVSNGIKISALTNGSQMQGKAAEFFAKHATWLRVSVDGWDDASYAEFRRVKDGEFTRVINNIKAFVAFGRSCNLGVSIIVSKKNAAHVYELALKLKGLGVHNVKIAACIMGNTGAENNAYHEPIYEIVKAQVGKAKAELSGPGFEIFDAYHKELDTFEKKYTWCPYLQVLPIIGADLNVYSCQDKAYNLDCGLIGSIKDVRFKDFWFSDKNKFYKINPSRDCSHHCVADAKNKLIFDYLGVDKEHLGFV